MSLHRRWIKAAGCVALALAVGCGGDEKNNDNNVVVINNSSNNVTTNVSTGDAGNNGGVDMGETPMCDTTSTVRPPGRSETMGIVDAQRRKIVFFGGDDGVPQNCNPAPNPIGGLWVYDTVCATWEEIEYTTGPEPRARGMAVYDPDRDQMVIFGGRYRAPGADPFTVPYTVRGDVWGLNLETYEWTELSSGGGPPARSNPAGGYNAQTGEMVVFGGNTSDSGLRFEPLDDVWAFDLETNTWREVSAAGAKPTARLFHSAAVDAQNNVLYIYGGGDEGAWQGPFLDDVWSMNLGTGAWNQLHPGGAGAPADRIWSTVAWDSTNERLLLFGGHDAGSTGNNNDTWAFDPSSGAWTSLVAGESVNAAANGFCDFPPDFTIPNLDAPDRRSAHLAALDETRGEWLIFGGKTDCGVIDDVWVFGLQTDAWVQMLGATSGEACVRGDTPDACVALCQ